MPVHTYISIPVYQTYNSLVVYSKCSNFLATLPYGTRKVSYDSNVHPFIICMSETQNPQDY